MKPYRIVSLVLVMLTLAACANTVRGVGRDINNTADAVEDSVN
jgi:predicted small secreted protein